jgi:hypothetical protein
MQVELMRPVLKGPERGLRVYEDTQDVRPGLHVESAWKRVIDTERKMNGFEV